MDDKISPLGVAIWLLALLFFFYEFFLRICMGTIASDVIRALNLSASQFSAIGAAYYITYGLMQIPVGLISEKLGARLTLSCATLICAVGSALLALSKGFLLAFISRLAIGFGSSFGFVSLLIITLKWFPKKHFGFMTGVAIFLGATGPILAGGPLATLYKALGDNWRLILEGSALFGFILTAALALFVRNAPKNREHQIVFLSPKEPLLRLICNLLRNQQVWMILLYSAFTYVMLPLFAAYWGTLFLQQRGVPLTHAAFSVSAIWVGYAVGSPLIGKLSDRLKRRTPFLFFPPLIGGVMSTLLLFFPIAHEGILALLFFSIGLGIAGQSLSFAVILEHVPREVHSSALGINNAATMLSSAIIPVISGLIIESMTKGGEIFEGALVSALSLVPLLFTAAFFLALFGIKETFCRQQHEMHRLHKFSDILD